MVLLYNFIKVVLILGIVITFDLLLYHFFSQPFVIFPKSKAWDFGKLYPSFEYCLKSLINAFQFKFSSTNVAEEEKPVLPPLLKTVGSPVKKLKVNQPSPGQKVFLDKC